MNDRTNQILKLGHVAVFVAYEQMLPTSETPWAAVAWTNDDQVEGVSASSKDRVIRIIDSTGYARPWRDVVCHDADLCNRVIDVLKVLYEQAVEQSESVRRDVAVRLIETR